MKILVVDDDPSLLSPVIRQLVDRGYDCTPAFDGAEALATLRSASPPFELVVTDVVMPGMGGFELLREVKRDAPDVSVILMSGLEVTAETAINAEDLGADDYLRKPLKDGEIVFAADRIAKRRELLRRIEMLDEALRTRYSFDNIIGRSRPMQAVFQAIEVLARHDTTALITGETGTGKDLVARAIHFNSSRRDARFVTINCSAIPEALLESELFGHERGAFTGAHERRIGKFELGDGGTVFLDELGDIPLATQVKILRVLESQEFERLGGSDTIRVNIRLIAATNADLPAAIAARRFRKDLYYRLNVVHLELPPLRERKEDIPLLVRHFLTQFEEKFGKKIGVVSRDAMNTLLAYNYPGNVRELENILERAVLMSKDSIIHTIPMARAEPEGPPLFAANFLAAELEVATAEFERNFIAAALQREGGHIGRTAAACGITERTLHRKMRQYGLDKQEFRATARSPR
jgi:DNA-binding NtrC family response regulator